MRKKQKISSINKKVSKSSSIKKNNPKTQKQSNNQNKLNIKDRKNNSLKKKDNSIPQSSSNQPSIDQVQQSNHKVNKKCNQKSSSKSKNKNIPQISQPIIESTKKLQRGYKLCQNCQTVLNIHKYVCTQCGYIHNMKKHKLDVMKNLSKCTPKIIKSIIQANQFNYIKSLSEQIQKNKQILTGDYKNQLLKSRYFPSSFNVYQSIKKQKEIQEQKQLNLEINQMKRMKSRKSQNKNTQIKQLKSDKIQNKNLNNLQSRINKQIFIKQTIKFKKLSITNQQKPNLSLPNQYFPDKVEKKLENCHLNQQQSCRTKNNLIHQQNKRQQQFSVYKSVYPILTTQSFNLLHLTKTNEIFQIPFLIFIESVSKKINETSISKIHNDVNFICQQNDQSNIESNNLIINRSKSQGLKKESQISKQQQIMKQKKLIQNNKITEKAFSLNKFHKIGQKYLGQVILNIIKVQQNKESQLKVQQNKVSPSIQLSKQFQEHHIIKIGIKQHVSIVKANNNKVALLSGNNQILLMNLDIQPFVNSTINKNLLQNHESIRQQKKKKSNQHQQENHLKNNSKNHQINQNNMIWLQARDFSSGTVSTQINKSFYSDQGKGRTFNYLNKIHSNTQDHFTSLEWLKSNNRGHNPQNNISVLVTGTLYGHILIYSINALNIFSLYRTIVSAHFQLINCIKHCPLSSQNNQIFATSSYDGSVKIWDLTQQNQICYFQVSNRKVQQIHWDSGAKFLITVRDEGLQNCYLSCFYSVSNRVELPIMLSESIDFRMIRNGHLFDNSSSPLVSCPLNCPLVLMLNSRSGVLKILQSQQLRKTSLKRKKSKKNSHHQMFQDYWLRLFKSSSINDLQKINNFQVVKINGFTPNNLLKQSNLVSDEQLNQLNQKENWRDTRNKHLQNIYENENSQIQDNSQQQDVSRSSYEQKRHNEQKRKEVKKQNTPFKLQDKLQEKVGLRKSLRVRKPNIQYNFIDNQEIEEDNQEKNRKNTTNLRNKQNNKKNRKRALQSQEDYQEELQKSYQDSQNQESYNQGESQNEQNSDSENSYENPSKKNKKSIKVKTKNIKKNNKNLSVKNTLKVNKIAVSNKLNLKKTKNENVTQKPNIKNTANNSSKIYQQLFSQQTAQQALNNKKQSYPTNKLPKFSSIASFYYSTNHQRDNILEQQNNKQHKNSQQIQQRQIQLQNKDTKVNDKNKNRIKYITTFMTTYDGFLIKMNIKRQETQQNIQLGAQQQQEGQKKTDKKSKKTSKKLKKSSNKMD